MKLISTAGRNAQQARAAGRAARARRNVSRRTRAARCAAHRRSGPQGWRRRPAPLCDKLRRHYATATVTNFHRAKWRRPGSRLRPAVQTGSRSSPLKTSAPSPNGKSQRNGTSHRAHGLTVGQRIRPLCAVGCYVPSGRYPLPSTLLMTVDSRAGRGRPANRRGFAKPAPETLAAAAMLGITEFYRIGGAQAIAALAYGTESIARVDKIVGPGNAYVTAAKKLVAFDCAIDMLAGPTEIVVTSENGNAEWIAADLVAQAEHDPDALAIFITTKAALARSRRRTRSKRASAESNRQRESIAQQRRHHRGSHRRRSPTDHQPPRPRAPHRRRGGRPCIGSETPAPSSSADILRSRWATTSPAPTTHCPPAASRACAAASASSTSSRSSPCRNTADGLRSARPRSYLSRRSRRPARPRRSDPCRARDR